MKKILQYGIKLIGVILFILILLNIDRAALLEALKEVSPVHVVMTILLFPIIYWIKAYRWHVLMQAAGARVALAESVNLYLSGLFLGIVTPGRLGEALKMPTMMSQGLSWIKSFVIIVIERLLDFALLSLMAIVGVGLLVSWQIAAFITGIGVIVGLIVLLLFHRYPLLQKLEHIFWGKKTWSVLTVLTVANWVIYFFQLTVLAWGFGIEIPILTFAAIMALVGMFSILPIAPAGLGTRDAAMLYLFSRFGIDPSLIVAYSLSIFVLTVLASSIGAFALIRNRSLIGHAGK